MDAVDMEVLATSTGRAPSAFLRRRRLRRLIMRVFLILRPKNMYMMIPAKGMSRSTVTQASDLTGLRFSLTTT